MKYNHTERNAQTREQLDTHAQRSRAGRLSARLLGKYPSYLDKLELERAELAPLDRVADDIAQSVNYTNRVGKNHLTDAKTGERLRASGHRPGAKSGITLELINALRGKDDTPQLTTPAWVGVYAPKKGAEPGDLGGIYTLTADNQDTASSLATTTPLTAAGFETLSETDQATLELFVGDLRREIVKGVNERHSLIEP